MIILLTCDACSCSGHLVLTAPSIVCTGSGGDAGELVGGDRVTSALQMTTVEEDDDDYDDAAADYHDHDTDDDENKNDYCAGADHTGR